MSSFGEIGGALIKQAHTYFVRTDADLVAFVWFMLRASKLVDTIVANAGYSTDRWRSGEWRWLLTCAVQRDI